MNVFGIMMYNMGWFTLTFMVCLIVGLIWRLNKRVAFIILILAMGLFIIGILIALSQGSESSTWSVQWYNYVGSSVGGAFAPYAFKCGKRLGSAIVKK